MLSSLKELSKHVVMVHGLSSVPYMSALSLGKLVVSLTSPRRYRASIEREANIIADLPRQYGKPEEWRFRKGTKDDILPVSKETLISTIKKCHQTLWGGGRLSPPMAIRGTLQIAIRQDPRRKETAQEW